VGNGKYVILNFFRTVSNSGVNVMRCLYERTVLVVFPLERIHTEWNYIEYGVWLGLAKGLTL